MRIKGKEGQGTNAQHSTQEDMLKEYVTTGHELWNPANEIQSVVKGKGKEAQFGTNHENGSWNFHALSAQ